MSDPGWRNAGPTVGAGEVDDLLAALASASRSRAGARHLMALPAVAALARDRRLVRLAGGVPYRATLFDKSVRSNWQVVWHQDTELPLERRFEAAGWGPWSMKAGLAYAHAPTWALDRIVALRLHLDDSGPDNGPLRVLEGSQARGVLSDEEVVELARSGEAAEIHARRGGVVVMHPLLVHASSKAASSRPRRVLHLEYADRLDLGGGARLAIA